MLTIHDDINYINIVNNEQYYQLDADDYILIIHDITLDDNQCDTN